MARVVTLEGLFGGICCFAMLWRKSAKICQRARCSLEKSHIWLASRRFLTADFVYLFSNINVHLLAGQANPVAPNETSGDGGNGNGSYVKLYLPGSPGNKPILGLKASRLEKVRIGLPPDQFIIKSPGLNGIDGTYSFESVKYPEFYLQRIGRDIYLKAMQKNPDFCK